MSPDSAIAEARRPELDAPSTVEFLREALVKISDSDIASISADLESRRGRLRPYLERAAAGSGSEEDLATLFRNIFPSRRRCDAFVGYLGVAAWPDALSNLLSDDRDVEARFSAFDSLLPDAEASLRRDVAGELLRLHDPDRYWLWSRWMWNPRTKTGSLPLVLVEGYDLEGSDAGVIYRKVGDAISHVVETAVSIGFQGVKTSRYAIDVYLCAIYGIYLYTVTRMRMTQEFNRVIPDLPELVRRMLGVHSRGKAA